MKAPAAFAARLLATGLFVSYLPAAAFKGKYTGAGFLGAVWGWVLMPWVPRSPSAFALFLITATAAAIGVCEVAGRSFPVHDDPRIILDEIVGYWTAAAFLPRDLVHLGAAFVLFRVFDVWKPWPVSRFERLPGGWGVVLDDSAAGAIACGIISASDACTPCISAWHRLY